MNADCYLDDDGFGPQVQAVEAVDSQGHRQSLHVRVGPVFYGNEQGKEPGIWIEYQEEHDKCLPAGPVLLTPAVWQQLNRSVQRRLRRKRGIRSYVWWRLTGR